jgi:hypothetical protein
LIRKITFQGSQLTSFDPNDSQARDLAWDGEYLWMVNSRGILKRFTAQGVFTDSTAELLRGGWGLTFGAGHIWVSDPSTDFIYRILVNFPPEAFSLLSPPDSLSMSTDTIDFDWEDSHDPDSVLYCLYLSLDSTFTDTLTTVTVDSLEASQCTLILSGQMGGSRDYSGYGSGGRRVENCVQRMDHRIGAIPGDSRRTSSRFRAGSESASDVAHYWKVKAYDRLGAERWSDETWEFYLVGPYLCGDCNGDRAVNFADALYVKNYYYQTPPESPAPLGSGDVNLDTRVNFADALYIKNYYYQTPPDSPSPCEPPLTAPFVKEGTEK